MSRILVGTPVRQKASVLNEFLKGFIDADKGGHSLSYFFVDDNVEEAPSKLLEDFARSNADSEVIIKKADELIKTNESVTYIRNDSSHFWNSGSLNRIANFKNAAIRYCIDNKYDYLFLIDSDIVINSYTIPHLISRNVDIVSNVFWSQWHPGYPLMPQCFWIPDPYKQYKSFNVERTYKEADQMRFDLFAKARVPGLYKVDGLGACTMITRASLEKGVSFKRIPNLSIPGEDRDFCIRAGVLGIDLYLDTVYPVYHIFREEYVSRVDEYKRDGFKFDMCMSASPVSLNKDIKNKSPISKVLGMVSSGGKRFSRHFKNKKIKRKNAEAASYKRSVRRTDNGKIVLAMVFDGNERDFSRTVESASFVDHAVIICKPDTGGSIAFCESVLGDIPHTVISFDNITSQEGESIGRMLWNEAAKCDPGWILLLDPGEVLQEKADGIIKCLIGVDSKDAFMFRRLDMYDEERYIDSHLADPYDLYKPYLIRFQPKYHYKWTGADKERFPIDVYEDPYVNIDLYVKDHSEKGRVGGDFDLGYYKDLPDEMLV